MENYKNWGALITRVQPLHNGHVWAIKNALSHCDNLLLIIGSANKEHTERNPFPADLRMKWLTETIEHLGYTDRVKIVTLADWSMEDNFLHRRSWGNYLYYNIVGHIWQKDFSIFYNDSLNIIANWFDMTIRPNVNLIQFDRAEVLDGISATKIRQAIRENDIDYIKKYCPQSVVKDFEHMRDVIEYVDQFPEEDFMMK